MPHNTILGKSFIYTGVYFHKNCSRTLVHGHPTRRTENLIKLCLLLTVKPNTSRAWHSLRWRLISTVSISLPESCGIVHIFWILIWFIIYVFRVEETASAWKTKGPRSALTLNSSTFLCVDSSDRVAKLVSWSERLLSSNNRCMISFDTMPPMKASRIASSLCCEADTERKLQSVL